MTSNFLDAGGGEDYLTVPGLASARVAFAKYSISGIAAANGYLDAPGSTNPQDVDDSRWKTVIAHELGHALSMGWYGDLQLDYSGDVPNNPLCNTSNVTGAGTLHSLQSVELVSIAVNEGFAHHVANRLMNNWWNPNPILNYYKEIRFPWQAPGTPPTSPPIALPAVAYARWHKDICSDTGGGVAGVEWDWMNFFWAVNDMESWSTIQQLGNILRRACGTYPGPCHFQAADWMGIDLGARAELGLFSSQHAHILTTGQNAGVDH